MGNPTETASHTGASASSNQLPAAAGHGSHYAPLPSSRRDGVTTAHAVQTILVEAQPLYELWGDVESIPLWQEHVVAVTRSGDKTSRWVMGNPEDPKAPRLEFDSEIYEDEPGRKIAWRTVAGQANDGVEQEGHVTFEPDPAGRGTRVTLVQSTKLPGGAAAAIGAAIAERGPKQTVIENLRHFKQLAEAGEIPNVEGQPHGPRGLSGGIKRWMYGENNPTPPGTGGQA